MQFEVNGQKYFLGFVEAEGKWYLFTPTRQGIHRIPVVDDGGETGAGAVVAATRHTA